MFSIDLFTTILNIFGKYHNKNITALSLFQICLPLDDTFLNTISELFINLHELYFTHSHTHKFRMEAIKNLLMSCTLLENIHELNFPENITETEFITLFKHAKKLTQLKLHLHNSKLTYDTILKMVIKNEQLLDVEVHLSDTIQQYICWFNFRSDLANILQERRKQRSVVW
jgi:hypothetical protein